MEIKTSVGNFYRDDFVSKCNDHSFPEGLEVLEALDLERCTSLTSLPEGLQVGGGLYLRECSFLKSLPEGLQVGGDLSLEECSSLNSLPNVFEVGETILIDRDFLERYPFREIPKILHKNILEMDKKNS